MINKSSFGIEVEIADTRLNKEVERYDHHIYSYESERYSPNVTG